MKKLLVASAVGSVLMAALSPAAGAATYGVISNITDVQLWTADTNLLTAEPPFGSFSGFRFDGWAADDDNNGYIDRASLQLDGDIEFTSYGLRVRLDFNLTNGDYAPGAGITFNGGSVDIEVQTTSGWVPYGSIYASITPLGFLANQPGHWSSEYPGQTTAGIVRDALPGLWDGQPGGQGFNRAVGSFALLGQMAGLYMAGTIEAQWNFDTSPARFGPPEVPVPAAAWLFGSALGCMGAARVRGRRKV